MMAVQLAFILLVAAPLAFAVSLLLRRWFVAAVKRSMAESVGAGVDESAAERSETEPEHALGFEEIEPSNKPAPWKRRRTTVVYVAAIAVYALITASVYLFVNELEFLPFRFAFLALVFAWPAVLAAGFVAAISWRGWVILVTLYFAVLCAVLLPIQGVVQGLSQIAIFWGVNGALGTVILMLFLARPIRAVGPMTLVFMATVIAGANAALGFFGASDEAIWWAAGIGQALGLNEYVVAAAVCAVGALFMAVFGWLALRAVGRLYSARLITDQTLVVDTMVLLFALLHAIPFATDGGVWLLAGLGAFVAYKLVTILGFALVRGRGSVYAPRVLLLRVFSLGKRSERLYDAFGKLWRRYGSIRMIAGPDLATSNVEPHEFLGFLHGQLSRRFIADEAGLDRQLGEEDELRRYDGRYGVAEFFCHDNTWRMALRRLVRQSEAVLMDLRGFTPDNQGCIYEIEALLELAPLTRVTFVIDRTTDEAFLHQTLLESWRKTSPDSRNRKEGQARARLFRLGAGKRGPRGLAAAVALSAGR